MVSNAPKRSDSISGSRVGNATRSIPSSIPLLEAPLSLPVAARDGYRC